MRPQAGLHPGSGGASGAVDSVNTQTGDVVLDADDVGAVPAGNGDLAQQIAFGG